MSMPKCENCHTEWSWKDTQKAMLGFKQGLSCPHCGETQFQTKDSMWRTSMVGLLPLFIGLVGSSLLDLSLLPSLVLIVLLSFLYLSIIPFFLELTSEEVHMW
ncbi:TIGR04104 family putative zinc finger protein [Tenuibacillus multivorans]|nr:TIGR04104 family putative zinc finger protein [Tenuibacillus multivorans]GEL77837.1 hypothetical protein TMU01_20720 [Tenuibacillus multivorans]